MKAVHLPSVNIPGGLLIHIKEKSEKSQSPMSSNGVEVELSAKLEYIEMRRRAKNKKA